VDLDLGLCCQCNERPATGLTFMNRRCVIPGHGWGCVVCALPHDGAVIVFCDACGEAYEMTGAAPPLVCKGYPAADGRAPLDELPAGEFKHDEKKHAEQHRRDHAGD
jgi:hypothetical protein